ncbi:hypothetical protein MUP77_05170 [Candidatus Bathyarchaeota archaeon]|nr:hypothetical protein [Candidatus Bathyarchaeota archaeon]
MTHFHLLSSRALDLIGPNIDTSTLEDVSSLTTKPMEEGTEPVTHPSVSKSGHELGEYDFFFEWAERPSWEQMRDLISRIDKALAPLGCRYTLVNK